MKKQILFIALTLLLTLRSYSQIAFEKGYVITENNQKTDCLIENMDWKNNPKDFRYRLSEDSPIINADTKTIKEFRVTGQKKFIRSTVNIDRSSKDLQTMTTEKKPIFHLETLFLQVLMEGNASLYLYDDSTIRRFFYKVNNSEVKQLVYKTYLVSDDNDNTKNYTDQIAKNNYFREQLYLDLKCDNIQQNEYETLTYTKNALMRILAKYNKCTNSEFVDLEVKEKKDLFNLTVRPRYNNSSLTMENTIFEGLDYDFGGKSSFSLGLEAEFILPFNKNRWAIFIEPTYQYYKGEQTIASSDVVGGTLTGKVDYKSIELPIGIRRYFFINENVKLFANGAFIVDFSNNSKATVTRKDGSELNKLDVKSSVNFGFGLGCKFMDKFSAEVRFQTPRRLLADNTNWSSSYQTTSLIVGYSFF
ncbi:outer membrane beta-barrel protein [Flavobacterium ginsenosidimutans]|uniref:outer membrane beta-barrel protein n=1 Tax=Flavobacterium ginsenosidimutans TaxID=687844 RepID=UPI000DAD7782|nr:outer membrane beta-barrel protein [Flavobacterium ginsenosidimutans]KAF2330458.1 PorT family protein [Flavobacterium ginsenosidimutans]